jgi:hypothetical protein
MAYISDANADLGFGKVMPSQDPRFWSDHTIYVSKSAHTDHNLRQLAAEPRHPRIDDLEYVCSQDFMSLFDDSTYDEAWKAYRESICGQYTAAKFEKLLCDLYEDESIVLHHIITRLSHTTNYPYQIFGFTRG